MRFDVVQKSLVEAACDVLVVNLFEGVKKPTGATAVVDKAVGGAIKALIEREKFEGKIGKVVDLTPSGDLKATKVVLVGLGKEEEFTVERIRRAASAAARRARDFSAKRIATVFHGGSKEGIDPSAAARAIVEGTILGTYQFTKHKTKDVKPNPIEQVEIFETDAGKIDAIRTGVTLGEVMANAINFARDLSNEPSNILTPSNFADIAQSIAKDGGLECQVMGRDEMKRMGLNLVLAVGQGSAQEPKFVVLRYKATGKAKTVAFVGKGLTFDSGGINLKGGSGMGDMKDDMSGAGVVLAAMSSIAKLKPKVNVLGIMPLTENMPDGNAIKPSDVFVAFSGKTVEIDNTDAEGRLVLADGIAYAEKEKADEIIDIATLTGACVVALGRDMAGIFGTNQKLIDNLISAGAKCGEKIWQLPLHKDYEDELKSEVADIRSAGGRWAGSITAALFLKSQVSENIPWVHIDIAGPCAVDGETPIGPKGGTGFGVGTLVGYVMSK